MNHNQVAHRFAHQNYSRNGGLTGPRMFAENGTLYSHGRHFAIARHTGNPTFPVLFTDRGYSVRTARHITLARRAFHGRTLFFCHDPSRTVGSVLSDCWSALECDTLPALEKLRREVAELESRISARAAKGQPESPTLSTRLEDRRGSEAHKAREIQERIAELERFRGAFNLKVTDYGKTAESVRRVFLKSDLSTVSATMAKRASDYAAKVARAQRAEEKRRAKENAEAMEAWLAGENVRVYSPAGSPARLRVKDKRVQTSQGAEVTCRSALALFALASRVKARGEIWECPPETEHKVDGYPVRRIDSAGNVVIGCHSLEWQEMARIETACREALA